jgi:hypothetical protein
LSRQATFWLRRVPYLLLVVFGSLAAQASAPVPSISIGLNFGGSTFGVDTSATPADANGAIGPRHFVEFINGSFAVYNKTNGAQVKRKRVGPGSVLKGSVL